MNVRRARRTGVLLALAIAALAVPGAGSATAANVVNGNFETGTLSGWQTFSQNNDSKWYIYSVAEELPGSPWILGGNFAAGSGTNEVRPEEQPNTVILYQDVALEPSATHLLTGTFRYESFAPMVTPSPNTLDITQEIDNQQDFVDVIKPTAPLTTTNPSDILATAFATHTGSPEEIPATHFSADLSAFAGQTVRLRAATVYADDENYAAIDDVAINSTPLPPPAPPAPSNVFAKGKLKLNKEEGTAKLTLTVPGPGVVKAVDAKKKKKVVKAAGVTAAAAGTVVVPIKPTGRGLKALNSNGKLPFKVQVSFTPTGGTASTQPATGTLKLQG